MKEKIIQLIGSKNDSTCVEKRYPKNVNISEKVKTII